MYERQVRREVKSGAVSLQHLRWLAGLAAWAGAGGDSPECEISEPQDNVGGHQSGQLTDHEVPQCLVTTAA